MNTLQQIYSNLQAGCVYGVMCSNYTFPVFDTVLYKTAGGFIGWKHYGSSATENTLQGLEWIISRVFDMTPTEFVQRYECKEKKAAEDTPPAPMDKYKIVFYDRDLLPVKTAIVKTRTYDDARKIAVKNVYHIPGAFAFNVFFAD